MFLSIGANVLKIALNTKNISNMELEKIMYIFKNMVKKYFLCWIILATSFTAAFSQRGAEADIQSPSIESVGTYHALLMGVSQYDEPGLTLERPLKDAELLKSVLVADYSFEENNVKVLSNPTRQQILSELLKLRKVMTPKDNLLIFYAGHGYWDEEIMEGYWWPRDGRKTDNSNWISNSDIRDAIRGIKTTHTLLISDACFSGGILKRREVNLESAPLNIKLLYKMPSRRAMTSGSISGVPDQSVFLKYLIKRLEQNTELYLPSQTLFQSLRDAVINNSRVVPQEGVIDLAGDEGGGDFIFVRKNQPDVQVVIEVPVTIPPVSAYPTIEKNGDSLSTLLDYGYGTSDASTVQVGVQTWIAKNLNVDHFANGDPIPEAKSPEEWKLASDNHSPAWCYYDFDQANGKMFGKLYNWYAVNDSRGLSLNGWHIPSDFEWTELISEVGGEGTGGRALKSAKGWSKGGNGSNSSGMDSRPGGTMSVDGTPSGIGISGYWWSTTESKNSSAWFRSLYHNSIKASRLSRVKGSGFSVRCVKD